MTFIHTNNHKSLLTKVIIALMVALFTGTVGLIIIYNEVVDLNHSISDSKIKLESIGAASAKLKNQIVAQTGGGQVSSFAERDGLVLDSRPQYFSVPIAISKQTVAVK